MNILIFTTHLNFGGIALYAFSLAKTLKKRGHNVKIASSGGDLVRELDRNSIRHIRVPLNTKSELSPKLFFSLRQLIKIVKKERVDIIHAQTRVSQVVSFLVFKLTGVPYVSTCHGFFKFRLSRRLLPSWGTLVIAISEAVKRHLICDLKVEEERIRLISNGVDLERFSAEFPQKDRINLKRQIGLNDGPIIGIIARLSPVKGHRFLIMAMGKILEEKSDAQLLIVGDGPSQTGIRNLAQKMKINNKVFFVKSVLDTTRYLSLMDVFVLPSLQEGLGLSIMEAQAAGIPVIASNVGGINTLIKDGQTGWLVSPGDSGSLAEAILTVLKDKELAHRMGRDAKRHIEENFSLERMSRRIEEVYREACGLKE